MRKLYRLCYTSQLKPDVLEEEVLKIVEKARDHNHLHNVTGMLLFINRNFFQVIEGEEKDIQRLYQAISTDERHSHIKVIMEGVTDDRLFENWTMGYKALNEADLEELRVINNDPNFSVENVISQPSNMIIYIMRHFYLHGQLNFKLFWKNLERAAS